MQRIKHWDKSCSVWSELAGTDKVKENGIMYYIIKVKVRGIHPKGLILPDWDKPTMEDWLVKLYLHKPKKVVSFKAELVSEEYGTQTVLYTIKCKWN